MMLSRSILDHHTWTGTGQPHSADSALFFAVCHTKEMWLNLLNTYEVIANSEFRFIVAIFIKIYWVT